MIQTYVIYPKNINKKFNFHLESTYSYLKYRLFIFKNNLKWET